MYFLSPIRSLPMAIFRYITYYMFYVLLMFFPSKNHFLLLSSETFSTLSPIFLPRSAFFHLLCCPIPILSYSLTISNYFFFYIFLSRHLAMTQKLLSAQCRHTPIPSDPDQATFSSFARHTHPMANHSHLTPEMPQLPSLLISTTPLRFLGSVLNRYIHAGVTYFVMRVTHLKV